MVILVEEEEEEEGEADAGFDGRENADADADTGGGDDVGEVLVVVFDGAETGRFDTDNPSSVLEMASTAPSSSCTTSTSAVLSFLSSSLTRSTSTSIPRCSVVGISLATSTPLPLAGALPVVATSINLCKNHPPAFAIDPEARESPS